MIEPKICTLCGKPWTQGHAEECTGQKPKRGRPPLPGGPQTAAQRQAARRERMSATISRSVATLDETMQHIEKLHLKAEAKQKILLSLALIAQDLSDYDKT